MERTLSKDLAGLPNLPNLIFRADLLQIDPQAGMYRVGGQGNSLGRIRQMRCYHLPAAVAFNVSVGVARAVGFLLAVLHPFGDYDADANPVSPYERD